MIHIMIAINTKMENNTTIHWQNWCFGLVFAFMTAWWELRSASRAAARRVVVPGLPSGTLTDGRFAGAPSWTAEARHLRGQRQWLMELLDVIVDYDGYGCSWCEWLLDIDYGMMNPILVKWLWVLVNLLVNGYLWLLLVGKWWREQWLIRNKSGKEWWMMDTRFMMDTNG